MTYQELNDLLAQNPGRGITFLLPDGANIPAHFHLTEVGHVRKNFVDCGGTVRESASCVLQLWVTKDVDHRLDSTKFSKILKMAEPFFESFELPVEVEYEHQVISQYPLTSATTSPSTITFQLGTKHTACLAPDRCRIPIFELACNDSQGCC